MVIDSQLAQSPSTITDSLYEDFDNVSKGSRSYVEYDWGVNPNLQV